MRNKRFPSEKCGWPGTTPEESQRWLTACETQGVDLVRMKVAHAGPASAVTMGAVAVMTAGFAQEWVGWMDRQKSARDDFYKKLVLIPIAVGVISGLWALIHRSS